MALKVKDEAVKNSQKVENQKAAASTEAATPVQETVNVEGLGADSDKLVFIAPLGDPSKPDTTPIEQPDGSTKKITTSTVVGYRFKATVDMEVPDVAPGDDLKNNLMSFTGDVSKTKLVKAGEEFDLTKFETGLLISQVRFNGRATGGDKPVVCSYTTIQKKGSNGTALASTAAATAVPSIALRALNKGQSIKDYKFIDVLDFTVINGENGTTRKKRTIKPGFEKFAALAKETIRTPRANSGATTPANVRNKGAEAFLAIAAAHRA